MKQSLVFWIEHRPRKEKERNSLAHTAMFSETSQRLCTQKRARARVLLRVVTTRACRHRRRKLAPFPASCSSLCSGSAATRRHDWQASPQIFQIFHTPPSLRVPKWVARPPPCRRWQGQQPSTKSAHVTAQRPRPSPSPRVKKKKSRPATLSLVGAYLAARVPQKKKKTSRIRSHGRLRVFSFFFFFFLRLSFGDCKTFIDFSGSPGPLVPWSPPHAQMNISQKKKNEYYKKMNKIKIKNI